jgi:hypothetical protein
MTNKPIFTLHKLIWKSINHPSELLEVSEKHDFLLCRFTFFLPDSKSHEQKILQGQVRIKKHALSI